MYTEPNFKIGKMPYVKLKKIKVKNFKAFDDLKVNFDSDFTCFIGPNGSGKSTTLEIIQSIFSNYSGYEEKRMVSLLGKSVRHVKGDDKSGVYGDSDFLIEAEIESNLGDYKVSLNKKGFLKDHPKEVSYLVSRLCYYTRFDQELTRLNLRKDKWDIFKELFEAVTGFEIEEEVSSFSLGNDVVDEEFVLGFYVKKPNETIHYKECSDGERKIMKSFSTLLSLDYKPSIILIDNVEMHVESGRHLPLINAMKKCFNGSQIVTTTHSYHISRNFCKKNEVYDLRLLKTKDIFKKESWRLQISDEIKDSLVKLNNLNPINKKLVNEANEIINSLGLENSINKKEYKEKIKHFMSDVFSLYVEDLIK
jgi:energy-coupling factor transporter ATP-binding protein EcfA2